jgi:hypothetical protein
MHIKPLVRILNSSCVYMLEKPHLTNSEVPPEFIVGATTALLILYVHICQPIGVYSVLVIVNTLLRCGLLPSSITWV